jgi:hypothetical protein
MLASAELSCKASIYPGVTQFGVRFDVYNDATVIDVSRDERLPGFDEFFVDVLKKRNSNLYAKIVAVPNIDSIQFVGFIGRAVLGNMRSFAIALQKLDSYQTLESVNALTSLLIDLAGEHFWALLEEVTPKLGRYEKLAETSQQLALVLFELAGEHRNPNATIRRDICHTYAKPLEILEYVGFIAKREASRAVKGGRGPRYRLNLAVLLENVKQKKLSHDLINEWRDTQLPSLEIAPPTPITAVVMPELPAQQSLSILGLDITKLQKSRSYPYGLTPEKIEALKSKGYTTVKSLAIATEQELDDIYGIGHAWVRRIKDVTSQAIWM